MNMFKKVASSVAVSAFLMAGLGGVALAQTATTSTTTSTTTGTTVPTVTPTVTPTVAPTTPVPTAAPVPTTVPGAPNTGSGGDAAANLAILGTSALGAIAGASYLARRLSKRS